MDYRGAIQHQASKLVEELQRPTVVAILVSFVTVGLMTRALSERCPSAEDGVKTPPMPAYWLPFFGHALEINFNAIGFLARMRKKYRGGVFSLYLRGRVHTFITQPALALQLLCQPRSIADDSWAADAVKAAVFGFRDNTSAQSGQRQLPLAGPTLANLTDGMLAQLKSHVADLVSFNSYTIDQMHWEKLADAELIEAENEEPIMAVDFMKLIRSFVAYTAGGAFFGTDFSVNFPEFWDHLWLLDEDFRTLATGLPFWAPWPRLQRAALSRRRMVNMAYEFHEAMDKHLDGQDPGTRWHGLNNVSKLEMSTTERAREEGRSLGERARSHIALAFSATVTPATLIAWMLFEISRDAVLLAEILDEIAPFVHVIRPEKSFRLGVWVPPKISKMDLRGLLEACPLLKAAYLETLRLYTVNWTIRKVEQDVVLRLPDQPEEALLLRKGTLAHVPQELLQLDPEQFPDPSEWRARRHMVDSVDRRGGKTCVSELTTMAPFGTY